LIREKSRENRRYPKRRRLQRENTEPKRFVV